MNSQCGSYRYDTFASQAQVGEFDRLYRQASHLLKIERDFWSTLPLESIQQVLDIGCGSGIVTRKLAEHVYPASVVGVDISQSLLDMGQRAYSAMASSGAQSDSGNSDSGNSNSDGSGAPNVEFQLGNIYDLNFPDNSFDMVYSRLLFQHLNEPMKALKSVARILRPGGFVCIIDIDNDWSSMYPQPKSAAALRQAVRERQQSQGGDPCIGRKLGSYLKSSGFSQVKTSVMLVDSDQLGLCNSERELSFDW